MNKFIGSGRLVREPEMHTTKTGKSVCTFTLAMTDGYGDRARSTFLPVVVWGKQGEACGGNLVKGQAVLVEGRVNVRDYEAKDGGKRFITEVVASEVEFGARPKGSYNRQETPGEFDGEPVREEEIPF